MKKVISIAARFPEAKMPEEQSTDTNKNPDNKKTLWKRILRIIKSKKNYK